MKHKILDAAEKVMRFFCICTSCFFTEKIPSEIEQRIKGNLSKIKGRIPRPVDYLVAVDDDIMSAIYAAILFYLIRWTYHICVPIICVGGKGLMSKHTHKKSEAELLAYVLQRLGISQERIIILGEGRNTGDNIQAVAKHVGTDKKVTWCLTKRLSLRLERTLKAQAPSLWRNSYYYVPEQSLADVMRLYNGKGLCNGEMLMHELASILNRCEAYAGTFQAPLEKEVPPYVREAARLLEQNFRLKLPHKTLKSYWQLAKLYIAVLTHKRAMKKEMEALIEQTAQKLIDEGLVGPGDEILGKKIKTEYLGPKIVAWNGCFNNSYEDELLQHSAPPYGLT